MSERSSLRASAQKVQDHLDALGFGCRVVELPASTRTAEEAAHAIGTTVAQIAKSLVFRGRESDAALLVIASGAHRVDERKLAAAAGEPIGRANADFVRERTGYAIGGVPPVGHPEPLRTFVDASLRRFDTIWAAAGTPFAVFRLTPAQLEAMTGGEVVELAS